MARITHGTTNDGRLAANSLDFLKDVPLTCSVELGRTSIKIRDFLRLDKGVVLELGKLAGEPLDLYANGNLVARGEVVVVNDHFGLRVTEITDPDRGRE